MPTLYPSWLEIPVRDLDRATVFYRTVFELDDTPLYDDYPPSRIVVLLPSDKSTKAPGVSLVQSPMHIPSHGGVLVNFHVGSHAALAKAIQVALESGGSVAQPVTEIDEGVQYVVLVDCEGNAIALSSYDAVE